MTIGFIQPALSVLEDGRVTTGELTWYIQELTMVIITAAVIAMVVELTKETIERK